MISPDVCSCCGEIWNKENLKNINIGRNALRFCPDCFKEYETIIFGAFEAGYYRGRSSAAPGKTPIKKAFAQWNCG